MCSLVKLADNAKNLAPNTYGKLDFAQSNLDAREFFEIVTPLRKSFRFIAVHSVRDSDVVTMDGSWLACEAELMRLEAKRYHIFFQIHISDGFGQSHDNMTRPHLLFLDCDKGLLNMALTFPLPD